MQLKKSILSAIFVIIFLGSNAVSAVPFAACNSEPMVNFDGTVVDAAIATPDLSTLVTAVTVAGLGDALDTTQDITVYAPTNDAFAAIPGDILDALLADTAALTGVLLYHVTPGINDPRGWKLTSRRDTLAEQPVFYHRQGQEARVNNAAVSCTGVRTTNGIVWIIDSVLLPNL